MQNKVAVITGSTSGIGLAIAKTLAKLGVKVVLNSARSVEKGATLAKQIPNAIYVRADVSDAAQCQQLIETTIATHDSLDILINNATSPMDVIAHKNLEEITDEMFYNNFNVNVMGAWYLSRLAKDHLKAAEDGLIINISSIAGIKPVGSNIAYCTAKAALNHLTLLLAKALAPAIRVNAIAPGIIATDRGNLLIERDKGEFLKSVPLQKAGSADDIAECVLAVINCKFMTGQVLVADGGTSFA